MSYLLCSKCIEYNGKLISPKEFEAAAGMKAMKSWKKSLKHRGQPLLTYLNSGFLKDSGELPSLVLDDHTQLLHLSFSL